VLAFEIDTYIRIYIFALYCSLSLSLSLSLCVCVCVCTEYVCIIPSPIYVATLSSTTLLLVLMRTYFRVNLSKD